MIIVSRKIIWDLPQKDGTHNVRDLCIDDAGNEYLFDYQAEAGTDKNKKLTDRIIEPPPPYVEPVDEMQVLKDKIVSLEAEIAALKKGK